MSYNNRYIINNNIDWYKLSSNLSAVHILQENEDKINWYNFCYNESIDAIYMIERNKYKIDWLSLSRNKVVLMTRLYFIKIIKT